MQTIPDIMRDLNQAVRTLKAAYMLGGLTDEEVATRLQAELTVSAGQFGAYLKLNHRKGH